MGVQTLVDQADAPQTIQEALDLAASSGATALLKAAALLANQRSQEVLPDHLFVAALAIGMPEPTTLSSVSSFSSAPRITEEPVSTGADPWLYQWFVARAGIRATSQFIRGQVGNAFTLPLRASDLSFGSRAKQPNTKLSQEAGALLGRASLLGRATRTSADGRFGVRHVIASLVLPDGNGANAALHALVLQGFKIQLSDAAEAILKNALRDAPDEEAAAAWRNLFGNPLSTAPGGHPASPESAQPGFEAAPNVEPDGAQQRDDAAQAGRQLQIISLSGFTSDGLAGVDTDPLGINPDVRAFARLICLEEATPPLSICLFGEWGSGKSTFMDRLQREIARLTRQKRPTDQARAA